VVGTAFAERLGLRVTRGWIAAAVAVSAVFAPGALPISAYRQR